MDVRLQFQFKQNKSVFISILGEWILLCVAFCITMAISRQKEARSGDYPILIKWLQGVPMVHSTPELNIPGL